MVRRRINKVKRVYTRARGIFGASNILQNPYIAGGLAGIIKNVINGQQPINIQNIQKRISQPNAKNPLIYILAGYFLKNILLMAIGVFQIVDPPASGDDIDTLSDEEIEALSDEEIEALSEEIAEEEEGNEKIYIH